MIFQPADAMSFVVTELTIIAAPVWPDRMTQGLLFVYSQQWKCMPQFCFSATHKVAFACAGTCFHTQTPGLFCCFVQQNGISHISQIPAIENKRAFSNCLFSTVKTKKMKKFIKSHGFPWGSSHMTNFRLESRSRLLKVPWPWRWSLAFRRTVSAKYFPAIKNYASIELGELQIFGHHFEEMVHQSRSY